MLMPADVAQLISGQHGPRQPYSLTSIDDIDVNTFTTVCVVLVLAERGEL